MVSQATESSNRTFMELKSVQNQLALDRISAFYSYLYGIEIGIRPNKALGHRFVLIVPLWN